MGNESERKQAFRGLVHATGFLQARVAARLQTRFTPVLSFKHDDSVKKSVELARVIEEAIASDQRPKADPDEADAATPEEAVASRSSRGDPDLDRGSGKLNEHDETSRPRGGRIIARTVPRSARPGMARARRIHRSRPFSLQPTNMLMATQSKTQLLTNIHALLKKRYKPRSRPQRRAPLGIEGGRLWDLSRRHHARTGQPGPLTLRG